jgi:hypothetical protein
MIPYLYSMTQIPEILLEGSYQYLQKDVNYSQENFKLVHFPHARNYHLLAEITSRTETGGFLKIMVRYEMNQHFAPTLVRIEKSIGDKYALELYKIDTVNLELAYTFQNSKMSQEFHRNISAKHYIATPAVSTAALFTLTKKFDATGRTPVVLISSNNDWTYLGPPTEKIVYAEFKTREMTDYKLNNTPLSASHLSLYEFDSSHAGYEHSVDLFLSKHFSVPYQLNHREQKVIIKNLKKNG